MRTDFAVLSLLALPAAVSGATCYKYDNNKAGTKCANKEELKFYAATFCGNRWNVTSGEWDTFNDSSGNIANIGQIGDFTTKASCQAAYTEIVDWCYNNWSGGTWTANGRSLNVNFCQWA